MDIDIQNVQMGARRQSPDIDAQGKPRCFHWNMYGHVKRHCRKLKTQTNLHPRQHQNVKISMADAASLAELTENN